MPITPSFQPFTGGHSMPIAASCLRVHPPLRVLFAMIQDSVTFIPYPLMPDGGRTQPIPP